ncbi:MAG: phosphoribosyltransferase family protein [Gammaproteobacteria bacterium]
MDDINTPRTADLPFPDRRAAGLALAQVLQTWRGGKDLIVLALSPGGIPVAREIADALNAPLDLLPVANIAAPGRDGLSLGAAAEGGIRVWNKELVRRIGVDGNGVNRAVDAAQREVARLNQICRGGRPLPEIGGRRVILVDDGLATGARMQAAVTAARRRHPTRLVVAVPVASPEGAAVLGEGADEVICLAAPEPFHNVDEWYLDFSPVSDADVVKATSH